MTPLPLWFWTAWQLLGLGILAYSVLALLLALLAPEDKPDVTIPGRPQNGSTKPQMRNKKGSAGRQPEQSKGKSSTKSITEKGGNVK